jgi:acyl-CoA carboxylase epsilon subunit
MATGTDDTRDQPPLLVVKGDASAEEVAALVAVLQGLAAASAGGDAQKPRSEWSSHHRKVRTPLAPGRGGWRSSALPR